MTISVLTTTKKKEKTPGQHPAALNHEISDAEYEAARATEEDLGEVRTKKIEGRRTEYPKRFFGVCTNPTCRAWAIWPIPKPGSGPIPCFTCNWRAQTYGGFIRPQTRDEIKLFKAAKLAADRRFKEASARLAELELQLAKLGFDRQREPLIAYDPTIFRGGR